MCVQSDDLSDTLSQYMLIKNPLKINITDHFKLNCKNICIYVLFSINFNFENTIFCVFVLTWILILKSDSPL